MMDYFPERCDDIDQPFQTMDDNDSVKEEAVEVDHEIGQVE